MYLIHFENPDCIQQRPQRLVVSETSCVLRRCSIVFVLYRIFPRVQQALDTFVMTLGDRGMHHHPSILLRVYVSLFSATNIPKTLSCPCHTAECNIVHPSLTCALRFAPCSSNKSTNSLSLYDTDCRAFHP